MALVKGAVLDPVIEAGGILERGLLKRDDAYLVLKDGEAVLEQYIISTGVDNIQAYNAGKITGDAASAALGITEITAGVIMIKSGIDAMPEGALLSLSGVGTLEGVITVAGAAAVALEGIAVTELGVVTFAFSGRNLISDLDEFSDSGDVGNDGKAESERIYEPSPKHDPQGGWGSDNPIPNNEIGQKLLDSAYSSDKTKQLYNYYEGDIIKFQPDSSSGKWHAYKVSNTATEVPKDVYQQMMKDGIISRSDYNKLIRNN